MASPPTKNFVFEMLETVLSSVEEFCKSGLGEGWCRSVSHYHIKVAMDIVSQVGDGLGLGHSSYFFKKAIPVLPLFLGVVKEERFRSEVEYLVV
jgi:hypothetical protein